MPKRRRGAACALPVCLGFHGGGGTEHEALLSFSAKISTDSKQKHHYQATVLVFESPVRFPLSFRLIPSPLVQMANPIFAKKNGKSKKQALNVRPVWANLVHGKHSSLSCATL
jgi:hypothetical protein